MTPEPVRGTDAHDTLPASPEQQSATSHPSPSLSSTASSDESTRPSDQAVAETATDVESTSRHIDRERTRLTYALVLSLLCHMSLLTLTFGGQGRWLPGFNFPWQDRRTDVPDLRVVLVPAQVTTAEPAAPSIAEPLQEPNVDQRVNGVQAPTPPSSFNAQTLRSFEAALAQDAKSAPEAKPTTKANSPTDSKPSAQAKSRTETKSRTDSKPRTIAKSRAAPKSNKQTASDSAAAKAPVGGDQSSDAASNATEVIAVPRTDEDTWMFPNPPATPAPVSESSPTTSDSQTLTSSSQEASDKAQAQIDRETPQAPVEPSKQEEQAQAERLEAERQNAARQEQARVEAEKAETARVEAARVEAARVEAARVEAARVEAARVEAARVEAARVEAARVEAARVEAARVEAARVESARIEAERAEAARVEAARVEAARVESARIESERAEAARAEAARVEAARVEAARIESARNDAQQAEARREERLRAIGRQLDAEAALRDAANADSRQSPSWSPARRYRLLGRTDPNEEIILYAEAWSQKIRMSVTMDAVREVAKQTHTDPLVWVAIRSDGSVESVKFVQSSGAPAVDEAIRRIVDSTKPYAAFPPSLARQYDVIEIRRMWHFDVGIQLY